MKYNQLLQKLAKFGIVQIARLTIEGGDDIAYLGRQELNVFPFAFDCYPVYLDNGTESLVDPYIVRCIARRFDLEESKLITIN